MISDAQLEVMSRTLGKMLYGPKDGRGRYLGTVIDEPALRSADLFDALNELILRRENEKISSSLAFRQSVLSLASDVGGDSAPCDTTRSADAAPVSSTPPAGGEPYVHPFHCPAGGPCVRPCGDKFKSDEFHGTCVAFEGKFCGISSAERAAGARYAYELPEQSGIIGFKCGAWADEEHIEG